MKLSALYLKKKLFFVKKSGFIRIVFFLIFCSCKNVHRNNSHKNVSEESIKKGEQLSKMFCQSCHMLPDPSLLDSKSWEKGVLPEMGPRLGIFNFGFEIYPRVRNKNVPSDFYPSMPVLSLNDWQNILDYYEATSPDSLPAQQRKSAIQEGLSLFKVEIPPLFYENAATSYVKIVDSTHSLLVSDAVKKTLFFLNDKFQATDSINTSGPVVDIDFNKENWILCNIGILNPNNGKFGRAEMIPSSVNGQINSISIFDSLQRPVQISTADFNKDGKPDYLVCEFGFLTGAFSWMENLGNNQFRKRVIRNVPGAIKAYVQDYNHDGLPDIWALFAQGEEGVFLFTNKGNGTFDQEEVLRFPPSYGSSYFELDDFNKDGFPDILYTCGDNADYSRVLKPYHGVYIFLNDGHNHFKQKFFFPIHGCYKAIARDYDSDGDLDIATISFFADYQNQPQEAFVYLQNKGNFEFQPFTIPQAGLGHWLTMDAGDFDGDGRTDLILGNFSIGPVNMTHKVDWKTSPAFIILKNTGK
jgi:hypothetical protein